MRVMYANGTNALFNCVNIFLDQKKPGILPAHDSKVELASRFNKYFKDKISDIRKSFPPYQSVSDDKGSFTGTVLDTFEPATEEEIRSLISTHGIKCSPEDPIPASLLKPLVDTFVPIWLDLINLSLEQGSIDSLKCGVLAPLIK